jgi:hypothetical protein
MYSCDAHHKFSFSFENREHGAIMAPLMHLAAFKPMHE